LLARRFWLLERWFGPGPRKDSNIAANETAQSKHFDFSWNIVVCSPVAYCTVSLTVSVCCNDPLIAVTVNA
jgi:hypothetical protein